MVLLHDVVEVSLAVAGTRSRQKKVELLAGLIGRSTEPGVLVALLAGEPRQGKIGVGYASVYGVDAPVATEPSVTVAEVDEWIDLLAGLAGSGSVARRTDVITELMGRCVADEQDYLRRVMTGEVRQGALEGVVVEAIAQAASVDADLVRRAVMLGGALPAAAEAAMGGGESVLKEFRMEVLRPIRPMLASTAADPAEAVTGLSIVDWKLDGARIQVHRTGEIVRVFTRNLNDVTARLPGVVAATLALPVESFIADGEAMAMDLDGRPLRFDATMSQFGADETVGDGRPLTAFFFDLLHVDGEDLLDVPLRQRLERLHLLVPDAMRIPVTITDDPAAAQAVLDAAVAAGHEGVMVKDADSSYLAGKRGAAWKKIKPVHTLDLVVLAAEWGHGRRTGWLSNLHLGARDGEEFVMLGKTFKGMTDEMLRWQTKRLLELELRRTRHTVYVRPELVVEIAIDGVVRSPRYPAGMALRFARVKGYREDKSAAEADTVDTVRAIFER